MTGGAREGAGAARGPTILLVEDEETIRQLLEQILESAGYSVIAARDGREAIEQLGAHPGVGLLVTDVRLPDVRGPELAEILRNDRPALRVLYMSGDPAEEARVDSTRGEGFLLKPFSLSEVTRRVRSMLGEP